MADYRLFHRSWEKSCQSSAAKRRQCGGNCQGYEKLEEFEKDFPRTALIVRLDVTDLLSVTEAVQAAKERSGGIDVLVNNAGYGYRAAVEEGNHGSWCWGESPPWQP